MLEIRGLSAGYGKKRVLASVDLCLRRGELLAVIGPNGCGKSTLLKTVSYLLPPLEGEVLLDGGSVRDMSRRERARRISYLPQEKSAPDMTVGQAVLHGRFPYLGYPARYSEEDRRVANRAMERMGVSSLADTPLAILSGGVRQRGRLAMALAQDTDYILLDEPTTYLDIGHQLELMALLEELAREGKGIGVVMHDLPMAFHCAHRVAVLNGGALIAEGTPKELCGADVLKEVFGVSLAEESGDYRYCYESKEKRT